MNTELNGPWYWGVGIEDTFVPQRHKPGERVLDEYELTQHYQHWKQDLDLVRNTGVSMVRYGIPWYRVEQDPGVFQWDWTDQVMEYFATHRELVPIIDLVHYGTPLWMDREFMNEKYPEFVAAYAKEFVCRYQSVTQFYTPLNEPFINAEWCGWSGTWPPYLKGHRGFLLIMIQLCQGIVRTVQAIKEVQPSARFVHVEAAKKYIAGKGVSRRELQEWNELRFLMWDLVQGKVRNDHVLHQWLSENGVLPTELSWFHENYIDLDIVGVNFYPQFSVNRIESHTTKTESIPDTVLGSGADLIDILLDLQRRYGKPLLITETSLWGTPEERVRWMRELVQTCHAALEHGIHLIGATWFPFLDMVDWAYRTNGLPRRDNFAAFGLYSLTEEPADTVLRRERNAAGEAFKAIVERGRP